MKEGMIALSEAVRAYRHEADISQDKLAEELNTAKRTISNIETTTGNPKMETLFPLIRKLSIDANRVFYPELHQGESAISLLKTPWQMQKQLLQGFELLL